MNYKLIENWREVLVTVQTKACDIGDIEEFIEEIEAEGIFIEDFEFIGDFDKDGDLEIDGFNLYLPPELIKEVNVAF